MSVERSSIGIGRAGAAVASRPATMGAPRSFGGGEKAMTGFAKYMGNTDRAVKSSEARLFVSAPKITPMPVHTDKTVRSFSREGSKILTPFVTTNSQTALSVRPEQRMQMPRTPRITSIRPLQAERRMMEQPRKIIFRESKLQQSLLDNKTMTFSDLIYTRTFPIGNKDLFFHTKTQAKEQTLFSKTLSPVQTENHVIRPTLKTTVGSEKRNVMPNTAISATLQSKEVSKPFFSHTQVEKPSVLSPVPSIKTEKNVSNRVASLKQLTENNKQITTTVIQEKPKTTSPTLPMQLETTGLSNIIAAPKLVESNNQQILTSVKQAKPDVAQVVPALKEQIPKEIATVDTFSASAAIHMQVEKQVDQMLLNQVKEQLASIITISHSVPEVETNVASNSQKQSENPNKKALLLLATVGQTEEKQKKNPLSKYNREAFRKFIVRLFKQVDEEKRLKEKKKEKKNQQKTAQPEKAYFIQDKNAMQNREVTINRAIKNVALKNNKKGEVIVDSAEIANQLPQNPSRKLISRIRFQILALILPGLFGDGSWDTVRYHITKLGKVSPNDASTAAAEIVRRFPAIELSQSPTAPSVSKEDVNRVFQTSNLPFAA